MKCPRCVQAIHHGAAACPHCGFDAKQADQVFGQKGPTIRCLDDSAGLIKSHERKRVTKRLNQLAARFPDLFLAIHTGRRGPEEDIRQFGLWLLNRASIVDLPEGLGNEAGILLSIDPESKTATMSWGYVMDPFLTEKDSFLILSRAHAYWVEGQFADGIERVIEQLALVLIRRSRQARWSPRRFFQKTQPAHSVTKPSGSMP